MNTPSSSANLSLCFSTRKKGLDLSAVDEILRHVQSQGRDVTDNKSESSSESEAAPKFPIRQSNRVVFADIYGNDSNCFQRAREWITDTQYWISEEFHFASFVHLTEIWNERRGHSEGLIAPVPMDLLENMCRKEQAEDGAIRAQAEADDEAEAAEAIAEAELQAHEAAIMAASAEMRDAGPGALCSPADSQRTSVGELHNLANLPASKLRARNPKKPTPAKTRSKLNLKNKSIFDIGFPPTTKRKMPEPATEVFSKPIVARKRKSKKSK